jgi:hypothetical protein
MQRSRLAVLLCLPLVLTTGCVIDNSKCNKGTGCDGPVADGGTTRDAGSNGGFDAGTDAGSNGGFDAGTDAGSDAGLDGGLVDTADWEGTGPLANCNFIQGTTGAQCGELSSFNLSSCQRTTLNGVGREGVFTSHGRIARPDGGVSYFVRSFSLRNDGGTQTFNGWSTPDMDLTKQFDANTWFVSRHTTPVLRDGGTYNQTVGYAGCSAEDSNHFTGCYAVCNDGQAIEVGSFRAARITPGRGESEASGLALVSETLIHYPDNPDYFYGLPVDIYVTKEHAYVVSVDGSYQGRGGLTVFNVSDPAHPTLVKQISSGGGYWNGVWAKGDALYIASSRNGVVTYDITNPANPVLTPVQVQEAVDAHTVFVEGNQLYAMGDPTRIYDISNPRAPALLGRYVPPSVPNGDPRGYVHDAFVYKGRMYSYYWGYGMQISDVSRVTTEGPVALGSYRYAANPDGSPWLNYSHSHAGAVGTYGDRLIAFEGGEDWGSHLRVLDVTNPASVKFITRYRLRQEASIHNMILDEAKKRLYIAYYQEGVRVLDVADPARPQEIAYYNTFRSEDPMRGLSFYEGAIGIRVPKAPDVSAANAGLIYVIDTSRGLLIFRETR